MRLSTYIKLAGLTHKQFAEIVGSHHVTVSDWARGAEFPRLDYLIAIQKATGDAVTANDMLRTYMERRSGHDLG